MRWALAAAIWFGLMSGPARAAEGDPAATLVYYNLAGNQTLDPTDTQNGSSYAHDTLLSIYDTLIRLDDRGTPVPGLAESWTRNADLTDLTLKLRPNVVFHDGTKLTAQTVVATFERNLALGKRAGSGVVETMGLIASMEAVGEDTVRLVLKQPNGQIDAWLGGPSGMIVSPAAYADGAVGATFRPIGAGPFKVTRFESNARVSVVRHEAYWGGVEGRPAGIEFHYVPDGRARLNAVRSGQATVALLDARQIPEAKAAGLELTITEKNAFWVMYFNLAKAGLRDVRVRRAFMHALDREALAGALTFGSARGTEQIFAVSSPLNVPALDKRYAYDPAKAKSLLAEAGFKDGIDISLLVLNNSEFRPLAEAMQAMLLEAGIRVKFDMVDVSQFTQFFQPTARGDMLMGRYGGRSEPVQMLFELVASGGPFSPGGSVSPELDKSIGAARVLASNDPRRDAVLGQAVEMASDLVALVPVMTRANVYAFKPGCVTNLRAYLPGGADRFNDVRVSAKCR